jgi:hypothetical protein
MKLALRDPKKKKISEKSENETDYILFTELIEMIYKVRGLIKSVS